MGIRSIATATLLLAGLAAGGSAMAQQASPAALTVPQVIERLSAQGYTDFTEVERDDDRTYEVEARHADGRRMELHVDARTAEILKAEQD
jgi:hypothetical protein